MRPTVKLGKIATVSAGNSAPQDEKLFKNGKYPFYRTADVGKVHYSRNLTEVKDYLNEEGIKGLKLFKKGTILFPKSGASTFLNHRVIMGQDGYVVSHLATISVNKDVDENFVYYYLTTVDAKDLCADQGYPSLKSSNIAEVEIPLPPLETQKAIVAKLDQIFAELDQTKSEIQKNLDNTDELWKSALNQAFQGDWEMKKLGEIYDITSSKRVFQKDWRTSGVPFYRAREIVKLAENGFVDNELFITEEMYEEYGKKYGLPKENDIMVTGVGTIGICYFVKKTDKFYFKDGNILWFKHNFEGINSRFVEYLFKSELLKSQINNGASTVVATLTIEKAKGLTIPVPPLSEQEKIVEYLDQVSKEVKELKYQYQSQLDNLEELKKSVLDKAFKGELGE